MVTSLLYMHRIRTTRQSFHAFLSLDHDKSVTQKLQGFLVGLATGQQRSEGSILPSLQHELSDVNHHFRTVTQARICTLSTLNRTQPTPPRMSPGTRRLRSARRADVPQPVEEETEDPAGSTAPAAASGTNPATSQDRRDVESPAVSSLGSLSCLVACSFCVQVLIPD